MARLPKPNLVEVRIEPPESEEELRERMKTFNSMMRKAITRRYIAEQKKEKENESKGETKDE